MTKEEILAMQPGSELDALVATEVMNIAVEWDYIPWDIGHNLSKQPFRAGEERVYLGPTAHTVANIIPEYSIRIAAAWQVVEKLDFQGWRLYIEPLPKGSLSIGFLHLDSVENILWCNDEELTDLLEKLLRGKGTIKEANLHISDLGTVPMAICKAALLAKLEEG